MRLNRLLAALLSFLLLVTGFGATPALAADSPDAGGGGGAVSGTVMGPEGQPVAGVDVLLLAAPDWAEAARTTSDDAGAFEAGVPYGTYRVQFVPGVTASVPGLAEQFFDGVETLEEAADVTVAAAPIEQVDARLVVADPGSAEPGAGPTDEATSTPTTDPSGEPTPEATTEPPTEPTEAELPSTDPSAGATPELTTPPTTAPATDPSAPSQPSAPVAPQTSVLDEAPFAPLAEPLADATPGTISGTVTAKATAAAVSGAWVTLYCESTYSGGTPWWSTCGSATTASDGTYAFGAAPATPLGAGRYKVMVSAPYGSTLAAETWLGGAEATATVLTLTGSNGIGGQGIAIPEGATISGTITGAGTVLGSTVRAWSAGTTGVMSRTIGSGGQVAADGGYTISGLPAGSYRLEVTPPSGSFLLPTRIGSADVTVTEGGTVAGIDQVLELGGRLAVTVTGPAAADAWVYAYVAGPNGSLVSVGSASPRDAEGKVTISQLPAVPVRLVANVFSSATYLTTWYDGKTTFAAATPIQVEASTTKPVTIALLTYPKISGTVTVPAGASAAGVTVEVCALYSTWNCPKATTADDGSYTVTGIQPGAHRVRAIPPADSNLLGAYHGGGDAWSAPTVTVQAGEQLTGIDIALTIGAEIRGTVRSSGAPVAGVRVTLYRSDADGGGYVSQSEVTTAADGTYVAKGLQEGTYRLRFTPSPDSNLATTWFGGGSLWRYATDVPAAAGTTVTRDVDLVPGHTVSGTLRSGAAVVPDATVRAVLGTGGGSYEVVKSATSGSDGRYELRGLAAGTYRLEVVPDTPAWLSTWDGGASFGTASPIMLASDDLTRDIEIPASGAIGGKVTSAGGPVGGARVGVCRVETDDAEEYCWTDRLATTASDGTYLFAGLRPGTYKVRVNAAEGWLESWFGGLDAVTATPIVITYGTKKSDADVALVSGGAITGTMLGAGAEALGSGWVTAYRVQGTSVAYAAGASLLQGSFTLSGLRAGTYVLEGSSSAPWLHTWFGGSDAVTATRITVGSGLTTLTTPLVLARGVTISGTIEAADGTGIAGAWVALCSTDVSDPEEDCDYVRQTSSGADGAYSLGPVLPGTYRMKAEGRYDSEWLTGWHKGSPTETFIVAGDTTGIDVVVPKGATISGRVTGEGSDGTAVPAWGAEVRAYRDGQRWSDGYADVAADGTFAMKGLEPGTYRLRIEPGSGSPWMSEWHADSLTRGGATPITVQHGEVRSGVTVLLARGGALAGAITGGTPAVGVGNVRVSVHDAETGWRVGRTWSQSDGTYEVVGLDEGDYLVQFAPTSSSGSWLPEWHADKPTQLKATPLGVATGAVTRADAELAPAGGISGTVRGVGDVAIPNALVRLRTADTDRAVASTRTNQSGAYVFPGLTPGVYLVGVTSAEGHAEQWYDARARADADPVTVTAGADTAAIDFRLPQEATIAGRVSGSRGFADDVIVRACDGDLCRSTSTDSAGQYRIHGLPAGDYRVLFDSYGADADEWYDNAAVEAEATVMTVEPGNARVGIDATLAAKGRLLGTLTDELGDGIQDAWVEACPVAGGVNDTCVGTSTTALGNWALRVAPGSYQVRFEAAGFVAEWHADAATEAAATPVPVRPAGDERVDATLAPRMLADGGAVQVTVTGTGAGPLAGSQVTLYTSGWDDEAVGVTDADGVATLPNVPPGEYVVSVSGPDGWRGRFVGGDGSFLQAKRITVAKSLVVEAVELTPASTISGVVTADGKPVDYVRLVAEVDGERVASAYTDETGQYRFADLGAAQYRIFVDADEAPGNLASTWIGGSADPASATPIELGVGDHEVINVSLVPAARIAGTVVHGVTGRAIEGVRVELFRVDAQGGGHAVRTVRTNDEGVYSFGHVPAGDFRVRAGAASAVCEPGLVGCVPPTLPAPPKWAATWFNGDGTFAGADSVSVALGQKRLDVDFALVPAALTPPPPAPGAPAVTSVGDTQVSLTWAATVGGTAPTGYRVTASPGGRSCTSTSTSCTVTGLANGTSYTFRVVATSIAGDSSPSPASAAVVPYGVPGVPGTPGATAGDGTVALSWAAPASDGGSAITGYRIRVNPGGAVIAASGTSATVGGLGNGTDYTFTVAAVNARGEGPASAGVTARPTAPADPGGGGTGGGGTPGGDTGGGGTSQPPAKTATAVRLAASPISGSLTTAITLTASGLPGNATGTVTFSDFGHVLGVVPVAGGGARITTKDIYGGSQTITASYSGDATFAVSSATAAVRITDKIRPSIKAPKASKSAAAASITFRAKDAGGVKSVLVRYRMSAPGKTKLGRWTAAATLPGTATSWAKPGGFVPRTKVCYQVRAIDFANRASGWKSKCTTLR